MLTLDADRWRPYKDRYSSGEWRATVFRDMVKSDIEALRRTRSKITSVEIGCGGGFDTDRAIQDDIARGSDHHIGIEPDAEIGLSPVFAEVHRCFYEQAPIQPGSVDLAYAVMVLEHLERPQEFWDKVYDTLSPGGVFWGFTMDARHYFVVASALTDSLGIKDLYLNALHGARGEDRYENYKVYYRSNKPGQVDALTKKFTRCDIINFGRVGQLDFYLPGPLRWVGRTVDRGMLSMGMPGTLLAVRAQK